MFAYCGNNPVTGYDPNGSWNWGGFFVGLALVATAVATVATLGATAPLLVAEVAVATTGVVTSVAAATDSTMVLDVSASNGSEKVGKSVVIDFGNSTIETYSHVGYTNSSPSVSYSVGFVFDYEKPRDYSGGFIEGGASYNGIGLSASGSPDSFSSNAKAICATFSCSAGFSSGGSVDYYIPEKCYSFKSQSSSNAKRSASSRRKKGLCLLLEG